MKALVLAGILVAAGAGFSTGILLRPGGGAAPVTVPGFDRDAAELIETRSRVRKLQAALDEANRRRGLAPITAPFPASPPPAVPAPAARADTAVAQINDALGRRTAEQAQEIAVLKIEIERLKAVLPEPQVLKDLRAATLDEVIALAAAIRKDVQERLLTPPESLAARFSSFLQRPNSGTARILPRGKFVHVIEKREGGAYWSFVTKDNDYNKEPDLGLEGENFKSGFYGGTRGYLLNLGDLDLDQVGSGAAPPPGLDDAQRERWNFLWSDSPFAGRESWREAMGPYTAFQESARKLGLDGEAPAEVGRTYLLRSMLPDEHEVLVVFRVADSDGTGMNLVWQVLKNWDIPRRR